MKRFLALAAVVTPLAFAALPSHAAPLTAVPAPEAKTSLFTQVQWGPHSRCAHWRRECAIRWGRGPGFHACMRNRGC